MTKRGGEIVQLFLFSFKRAWILEMRNDTMLGHGVYFFLNDFFKGFQSTYFKKTIYPHDVFTANIQLSGVYSNRLWKNYETTQDSDA